MHPAMFYTIMLDGTVVVETAGGEIVFESITGSIEAKTAGGDIRAEFIPVERLKRTQTWYGK
jgi:DUF4097 and DUF4098 domain-containing protein YvlB